MPQSLDPARHPEVCLYTSWYTLSRSGMLRLRQGRQWDGATHRSVPASACRHKGGINWSSVSGHPDRRGSRAQ